MCTCVCACARVCVCATRPVTLPCPDSVPGDGEKGGGEEGGGRGGDMQEAFCFSPLLEASTLVQPEL